MSSMLWRVREGIFSLVRIFIVKESFLTALRHSAVRPNSTRLLHVRFIDQSSVFNL